MIDDSAIRLRFIDTNTYPKGVKVSDAEMDALNLHRHTFHGEWNYAIKPKYDAII